MAVIDAKYLATSVEHSHLELCSREAIDRGLHSPLDWELNIDRRWSLALTLGFLTSVFSSQAVEIDGCVWKIVKGVAAGIPCGVHLANIYLDALDVEVVQRHASHMPWYARFVDDVCVCIQASRLSELPASMNVASLHCVGAQP